METSREVWNVKKIGIGYEDYKEFIDDNLYYIDKTMLIADVVEKGGKVNLFTRPRRFGKTLALSMLRTFFELLVFKQHVHYAVVYTRQDRSHPSAIE